jgi:hypothetical protein
MHALPTQKIFEDFYIQIEKNNAREDKQLLTLASTCISFRAMRSTSLER